MEQTISSAASDNLCVEQGARSPEAIAYSATLAFSARPHKWISEKWRLRFVKILRQVCMGACFLLEDYQLDWIHPR